MPDKQNTRTACEICGGTGIVEITRVHEGYCAEDVPTYCICVDPPQWVQAFIAERIKRRATNRDSR